MKAPAMTLSMLKLEAVAKRAPREKTLRDAMALMMGGDNFVETINALKAEQERPYVSDMAWAIYSAYTAIILGAWGVINALSKGLEDADKLIDANLAKTLLESVLPHRKEAIERVGFTGYYHFMNELEALMLAEIRAELEGQRADEEAVRRNAALVDAVNQSKAGIERLVSAAATDKTITVSSGGISV